MPGNAFTASASVVLELSVDAVWALSSSSAKASTCRQVRCRRRRPSRGGSGGGRLPPFRRRGGRECRSGSSPPYPFEVVIAGSGEHHLPLLVFRHGLGAGLRFCRHLITIRL